MKKPRKESGEVTLSAIEGVVTRAIKEQVPGIVDERLGNFMRDDMIPALDLRFAQTDKKIDLNRKAINENKRSIKSLDGKVETLRYEHGQKLDEIVEKIDDHAERIDLLEKEVYPTATA